MLPKWLHRRVRDRFSVSKFNRRDCQFGSCYDGENRIEITADQVLDVCRFDCTNSIMLVGGKIRRRLLGAPMGGFLSAFYAMLAFACIEYRCLAPLFSKLGLPGGQKRYLDDLLVVVAYKTDIQKQRAITYIEQLQGTAIYPPPLCLNVEPIGDQEFLETTISGGSTITMKLLNKVFADQVADRQPYRQRLSGTQQRSTRDSVSLIQGIVLRGTQFAYPTERLVETLLEVQYEASRSGVEPYVYRKAASRVMRSCKEKEKNEIVALIAEAETGCED